jgi:xylan 1,4-beta-xylosidase
MALDFLLSIGLKPMIQLSFMPMALAENPSKTVCQSPFNTSPPKDIEEWNLLIEDFTKHLISRYSKEEVLTWLFCVWNEPATSKKMFGFGDNLLFFNFYIKIHMTP